MKKGEGEKKKKEKRTASGSSDKHASWKFSIVEYTN